MQLDLFGYHNTNRKHTGDTRICKLCKEEHPTSDFYVKGQMMSIHNNKDTVSVFISTKCKTCYREEALTLFHLRKQHRYPDNNVCDCCGTLSVEKLVFDHCHDRSEWRGWLCRSCNLGIGMLGDNIEGITRAVEYLNRYRGKQ